MEEKLLRAFEQMDIKESEERLLRRIRQDMRTLPHPHTNHATPALLDLLPLHEVQRAIAAIARRGRKNQRRADRHAFADAPRLARLAREVRAEKAQAEVVEALRETVHQISVTIACQVSEIEDGGIIVDCESPGRRVSFVVSRSEDPIVFFVAEESPSPDDHTMVGRVNGCMDGVVDLLEWMIGTDQRICTTWLEVGSIPAT